MPGEISAFCYTKADGHTIDIAGDSGLYARVQKAVQFESAGASTSSAPVLKLRAVTAPAGILAIAVPRSSCGGE